jgi:DNA-binding transcriptional regulator YhcF (GntR family)
MSVDSVIRLPKRKPKISQREPEPDARKLAVVPFKAITDQALTDGAMRVLALVCSYCNRAGITWVSQARLAKDMAVSRQAISNQFKQLRDQGYIEIVKKGWRGERSNTVRVIFDKTIDVHTAIAITSAQEDTRPPSMQDQEVDPLGQQRIAKLIAQAFKSSNQRKEAAMSKPGESRAVKAIKEANQKGKARRSIGQPTVAHEETHHRQPIGQPTVALNTGNTYRGLTLEDVKKLREEGLTDVEITGCLDDLLSAYAAEGITPKPEHLAAGILQLNRDANRQHHQEGT